MINLGLSAEDLRRLTLSEGRGHRIENSPDGRPRSTRRIYNRTVPPDASSPIILAENLTKVYGAGRLR